VVLENHHGFKTNVSNGRHEAALAYLNNIFGLFPELDARYGHKEAQLLVKGFCELGDAANALRTIDSYFGNFRNISKDPRLKAMEGDCRRMVAQIEPSAVPQAQACYEEAHDLSDIDSYKQVILQKKDRLSTPA